MTPLLLLDVDGVLNALPEGPQDLLCWPEWESGWARSQDGRWHITFAPPLMRQLRAWHESGQVEIQWLTTWGHDANDELRELLQLPELVVAGTYQDVEGGVPETHHVTAAAHADVAPAAPDPLSGRWWKYDVVQRVLRENPGRTVVWIDDELHTENRFTRWAAEQPHLTAVGPNPRSGLAADDLASIAEAAHASSEQG